MKGPIVGTEVLTFREGKMWIAVWRRFDVVAQGKTEKIALQRLIKTIASQAIWDAADGTLKTFGSAGPPPPDVLKRWEKSHLRTHSN